MMHTDLLPELQKNTQDNGLRAMYADQLTRSGLSDHANYLNLITQLQLCESAERQEELCPAVGLRAELRKLRQRLLPDPRLQNVGDPGLVGDVLSSTIWDRKFYVVIRETNKSIWVSRLEKRSGFPILLSRTDRVTLAANDRGQRFAKRPNLRGFGNPRLITFLEFWDGKSLLAWGSVSQPYSGILPG